MITKALGSMLWVGAVGASAISCYMLSLGVASERAQVEKLDRRIVATRQEIRTLEAELGTRGRLSQLERWNREVLALGAPAPAQYLDDELVLASVVDGRLPVREAEPEVRMASAETAIVKVTAVRPDAPRREREAAALPVAAEQPALRHANFITTEAKPLPIARAALIDDTLARDVRAAARAERKAAAKPEKQ